MPGPARCDRFAVRFTFYATFKYHAAGFHFTNFCVNSYLIFISGRVPVTAMRFHHRKKDTLCLPVGVGFAEGTAELCSAHFEPVQIIRVIDYAHLVCISVADSQRERNFGGHRNTSQGREKMPPAERAALKNIEFRRLIQSFL
jgi:hypothetical protein